VRIAVCQVFGSCYREESAELRRRFAQLGYRIRKIFLNFGRRGAERALGTVGIAEQFGIFVKETHRHCAGFVHIKVNLYAELRGSCNKALKTFYTLLPLIGKRRFPRKLNEFVKNSVYPDTVYAYSGIFFEKFIGVRRNAAFKQSVSVKCVIGICISDIELGISDYRAFIKRKAVVSVCDESDIEDLC